MIRPRYAWRLWPAAVCVCGFVSVAAGEALSSPTAHVDPPASSGWQFAVTPYFWLPSVGGSLRYGSSGGGAPAPETGVDSQSLIDHLKGAFMIAGEVKKDRWLAVTDYIYVNFENAASNVKAVNFNPGAGGFDPINTSLNTHTETSLTGLAWTLLGGYRAIEGVADLDVLVGLRYFELKASTNWQLSGAVQGPNGATFAQFGSISDSTRVWDGLFAVRGRVHLGSSRWYLPYYFDIGSGQSKLTCQAFGGAGFAFKSIDVSLTYRTLYYDERHNGLMYQLSFTGPAAAVSFRF